MLQLHYQEGTGTDCNHLVPESKQDEAHAAGDLTTGQHGSRQTEEADLEHHMTAALAHVPADTAVIPATVLQHVDLLQQV